MKKAERRLDGRRVVLATLIVSLGLGVVACSKESSPPEAKADAGPVRGEPIRGEPIAKPEAPTAVAAATAAANPRAEATPAAANSPAPAPAATATVPSPAPAPVAAKVGTPDQPLVVGFDKLGGFQYALPDGPVDTNKVDTTKASAQIPDPVKSLNDQFVSLKGFMMPLKVEKGLVTELLIMRDQSMCCYGAVPRINEWVSVKMVGAGVKPIMDQAVTLFGKLKVGEMYENGYLVGIYSLDGERMAGPLDL